MRFLVCFAFSRVLSSNSFRIRNSPDLHGATYSASHPTKHHNVAITLHPVPHLNWLTRLRRTHAHGPQHDFISHLNPFDGTPNPDPNLIAWTREGLEGHPGTGLAVLLSKDSGGTRRMFVGSRHANTEWKHYVNDWERVWIGDDGWIDCKVGCGELGVWIPV